MERWINVDWEKREVMPEAFASEREAWRAAADEARKQNRSPYEWDRLKIDVEAK